MDAIKAGLLAWAVEIAIATTMLLLLRFEEYKVIRGRSEKSKR